MTIFLLIIVALATCVGTALQFRMLQIYIRFHYQIMSEMRSCAGSATNKPISTMKGRFDGIHATSPANLPTFAGEKKRGSIFIPPTAAEEAREEILQRNRAAGVDTPLADLYKEHGE